MSGNNSASKSKGSKSKKNRGSEKVSAKSAPRAPLLYEGKEYQEAMEELLDNTVILASDIDMWIIKLLDNLVFLGKAEEAIEGVKATLHERTRDQVKNPGAYVFALLNKFKKEAQKDAAQEKAQMSSQRKVSDNGLKSDFRADAPDFVPSSPCPPFSPSFSPAMSPSSFAFRVAATEFVPSTASATPEMQPTSQPCFTPEHVKQVYVGEGMSQYVNAPEFKPQMLQFAS